MNGIACVQEGALARKRSVRDRISFNLCMPEQGFDTLCFGDFAKHRRSVVNTEQKGARMSCSGVRSLLLWCRQQTESYSEVNVINMTTSWRDGLAFCAIIHHYRPDLIDFDRLSKENPEENNELAFSVAEKHFAIPMVFDARDMVERDFPDKLGVITYVSQLYEYFKNKIPANQGYATKMKIKPKPGTDSKSQKASKRSSPSNQMYLLSGHARRVATALRNVFKSESKEDSAKGKETGQGSKSLEQDSFTTNLQTVRSSNGTSANSARKSPFLGTDCYICHKRVYFMERLIAERKLFHRACFRCCKCNACLRLGTYHYSPETDTFCCLFDCPGGLREVPIKIKLEAISSSTKESFSQETTFSKMHAVDDPHSTDLTQETKSNIQRQFSIVKKNAIQLNSLPQPVNNTTKHSKKSKVSKTSAMLRQNSKGEKKRRFSGNRKAKSKQEGKSLRLSKQSDPTMASWSPVHKRHAPERKVKGETSDMADNKISVDETNNVLELKLPLSDLASKEEEQETFIEAGDGKPGCLRMKPEKRTSREESVYELSSENLFFSFKEELLKRAFETKEKDDRDVECKKKEDKVADSGCVSNLNECQKEVGSSGDSVSLGCHTLASGSEVKDSEKGGKVLEHSVVADDVTTGSHESSSCDLKTAPVATKSVQELRERFLNIDDMIEEKNKTNLAKKSQEIQRELRCVSAWKQKTGSHGEAVRRLSVGKMAARTTDLRKSSVGISRRSVKELRKMYMGGGSDDSNGSKEKLNLARSKSMRAAVNMERNSSASGKEEIPSEMSHGKSEKNTDSTVLESTKVVLVQSKNNCDDAQECSGESEKSVTDAKGMANTCVGGSPEYSKNQVSGCYKQNSNLTDQIESLIEEKCTSDDCQSKVPSLQIQPASPEPMNGQQHSSGLKRIAASHDSGIDEPSMFGQSNSLNSETDEKISAESLKIAAEFSFSGSETNDLSLNLRPSKSEPVTNLPSPDIPLSLYSGSDVSAVEIFWSLPLSVGRRTSITDTSSSCSSPRMSVVIAQEVATTKINSRYFTVESTEPWDFEDSRIAEEHQCVMEVEGEFSFGREKRRTSRAERQAIYSLHRDAKSRQSLCLNETGLIKEDEVTLSPMEIDAELQTLEERHGLLERRGVEIEHQLRESMDSEGPYNDGEDELFHEWLYVVHERNKILRRESELIYLLQSHNYEERYRTVEGELRKLVAMRDEVKSSDDLKRERELLSELLELVQRRSFIVDSLEEERVREIQEDEKVEQAFQDGVAASPDDNWDQTPDFTKVAFSRFYC
ncbi:uncharacterized protein LOC141896731 isoform X1 [Acropora palmata]|uniref:uncharacterized protein LOC141896731 isoform X1 n=1 Tax=Acropora palmata TaxID=6131 RepID=UPI003DA00D88